MTIVNEVLFPAFAAGIVTAKGVKPGAAPAELSGLLDDLIERRSQEEFPPASVKDAVRKLLKQGGFKPTGRNKPASEYLAQAAREGRFPRINNLVDVNNLLSLETGLPISLLDLSAFAEQASLRCGRPGEKYVFNSAGQEIDLDGLICVCGQGPGSGSVPLGNPVKDSMLGKLKEGTQSVLGVIYASLDCEAGRNIRVHTERFAALLKEFCGACEVATHIVGTSVLH
jgi:DNA/RNA-binding domain of Phe-tRNA-synthetase-like protein